jgi:hypothetical protein
LQLLNPADFVPGFYDLPTAPFFSITEKDLKARRFEAAAFS